MSLRAKLELDIRYSVTGDRSLLTASERARLVDARPRAARELSVDQERSEHSALLSEVALGAEASARPRIERMVAEAAGTEDAPFAETEAELLGARLASSRGSWAEVVRTCSALVREESPGICRLTAYQLLANALFEAGDVQAALQAVRDSSGLRVLYPYAPVVGFLAVNEAKALAASERPGEAREVLRRWMAANPDFNADQALTLLRGEAFLRLYETNAPARALEASRASYALARAMGDDLYAGLALAEAAVLNGGALPPPEGCELAHFAATYARVRDFIAGETGYFTAEAFRSRGVGPGSTDPWRLPRWIFLPAYGLAIDLGALRSETGIEFSALEGKLLAALADGNPHSRADFFRRVWRLPFDKERHKTTLTMALSRLKKKYRLSIRAERGAIAADSIAILGA